MSGDGDEAVFEAVLAAGAIERPDEDADADGGENDAEDFVEGDVGVGLGSFAGWVIGQLGQL